MSKEFTKKHIGLKKSDIKQMLTKLKVSSIDELIYKTIPNDIIDTKLDLKKGLTEAEILKKITKIANKNKVYKTYIGQGYYDTFMPAVIKRNILENPSWYTAYTPYQAEISQGRLEMLLNFQHMIIDLTKMDIANASLLDEASAVVEAMLMCKKANIRNKSMRFLADANAHPQVINVLRTRAKPLGIKLAIDDIENTDFNDYFACVIQYPDTYGEIRDLKKIITAAQSNNVMTVVVADILSLLLLKAPGEFNADVVVGSTQRLGIPLGFGGPHAAYLATKDNYKRLIPGRIIGISKDVNDNLAYRMALQTREQHIRRDKATSNICTSQVLLAILATAYAMYHKPKGLRKIANRINKLTRILAYALKETNYEVLNNNYFDTLTIKTANANKIYTKALAKKINFRLNANSKITLSIDENTTYKDIEKLAAIFEVNLSSIDAEIDNNLLRNDNYLKHPIFNKLTSETAMMRYFKYLENKDIALNNSMIALGSCTMKLNAAVEMYPITFNKFSNIHPYAPKEQTLGYQQLFLELQESLKKITGYDAVSLQPNAGSQGELSGLLTIKNYYIANGENKRNICFIPSSAHGTNPASAVLAGMKVVIIKCDNDGNIDLKDLKTKAYLHRKNLAVIMITYPSTHGVFEEGVVEVCNIVHSFGGQVYIDGANLNAMIGYAKFAKFGGDVSHFNLHKTFAIPHGGGGPGVGPIGVKKHLAKYLPGSPLVKDANAVTASEYGSASILPISYVYISLLGKKGLKKSTAAAILSANYIAKSLQEYYPVLYTGKNGYVAHECILDLREIKASTGISEEDIAKRLIDYSFHAPTMSFPVLGTLMIEPTESEPKTEIDRFIQAMISIKKEIEKIKKGEWDKEDNPLKNAPHTVEELTSDWNHCYSRKEAFYPVKALIKWKYFPAIKRVDNVYGDRHLFCSCPNIDESIFDI